jgi:hypothetical protein
MTEREYIIMVSRCSLCGQPYECCADPCTCGSTPALDAPVPELPPRVVAWLEAL